MITIHVEKTASRGIVIGKAFILEQPEYNTTNHSKEEVNPQQELGRFESAVSTAVAELEKLADTNSIFEAHLEMVKDITLQEGVVSKIREEHITVEAALESVISEFLMIFESMDDEYMRERAADIKDIRNRLMRVLSGVQENHLEAIKEEVILVAKDLTPSDTAALDLSYILGFVTMEGGVTSHVSIMAKGLGIPALVGVKDILSKVKNGDILIMEAGKGEIIINPDEETLRKYQQLKDEYKKKQEELEQIDQLPAVTLDGREVHLCVNVGGLGDIRKALTFQMDGVGLFRSEFLYMDNTHFPTEEEQFQVYKEAVQLCSKEVIIRTLDIGGDKSLPYYEFEKEENPFLGWRAIRISLELNDIFKAQLRAILRASAFGAAKIMFPMIISVEELHDAKLVLEECKKELTEQGITYNENIRVGIMVETPASIILIEDLAKEVDFISIGTNDLTQYLLAVDRGNKKISNLYNSFHPAVIRSIKKVIEAGHRNNIKVGMCGEFASDEKAVRLLLGLGLDEFSMSASELWNVKTIIRNSSYEEVKQIANLACEQATLKAVYEVLDIQK